MDLIRLDNRLETDVDFVSNLVRFDLFVPRDENLPDRGLFDNHKRHQWAFVCLLDINLHIGEIPHLIDSLHVISKHR